MVYPGYIPQGVVYPGYMPPRVVYLPIMPPGVVFFPIMPPITRFTVGQARRPLCALKASQDRDILLFSPPLPEIYVRFCQFSRIELD